MNEKALKPTPLDALTYAAFAAAVNTRFRVQAEAAAGIELELTDLRQFQPRPAGAAGPAERNECFSLTFTGPASRCLEQRTYELEHDQMGQFSLFLVPIGKDQRGYQYEAVFNRFV